MAGVVRQRARPLLHVGGSPAARARKAGAVRRERPGVEAAAAGASSTGSTSRRTAPSAWSTTKPVGHRGREFEAKALFQMRFYALIDVAGPRRRPSHAEAGLPRRRADHRLRPRRAGPAGHRAQGRGDLARHPHRPRRSGELAAATAADCAAGAPTRRSARVGGALPPPLPEQPVPVDLEGRPADRLAACGWSPPQVGPGRLVSARPGEGVAEEPPRPPGHAVEESAKTWFSSHAATVADPAALGRLGAGVGVLDRHAALGGVRRARPPRSGTARDAACRTRRWSPVTITRNVSGGSWARIGATKRWYDIVTSAHGGPRTSDSCLEQSRAPGRHGTSSSTRDRPRRAAPRRSPPAAARTPCAPGCSGADSISVVADQVQRVRRAPGAAVLAGRGRARCRSSTARCRPGCRPCPTGRRRAGLRRVPFGHQALRERIPSRW